MSEKTGHSIKVRVINAFGSFGYISCFLQWFWAIMLYFSVIQSISKFTSSSSGTHIEQSANFTPVLPTSLEVVLLGITVVVMIVLMIYAFVSIPRGIVKTSNKIVHKTAETVAPLVIKARHQQNTKKRRITMTSRVIFGLKLLLIAVAIGLSAGSGFLTEQAIAYPIAMVVSCVLACGSIIFFALQYTLAKIFRVELPLLW